MLETLVSILIFSLGLLGLSGLQSKTLGFSQSAMFRSQATLLADDILERMRVDRGNVMTGGGWNTNIDTTSSGIHGSGFSTEELRDWKLQVEALLPSGKASIEVTPFPATDPTSATTKVILQWDDSRAGGGVFQQFVTITQF